MDYHVHQRSSVKRGLDDCCYFGEYGDLLPSQLRDFVLGSSFLQLAGNKISPSYSDSNFFSRLLLPLGLCCASVLSDCGYHGGLCGWIYSFDNFPEELYRSPSRDNRERFLYSNFLRLCGNENLFCPVRQFEPQLRLVWQLPDCCRIDWKDNRGGIWRGYLPL